MTGIAVAIEQITSRSWGSIFPRNFSRMYIQVFSSHLLFKVCLMQGDFKAIKIRIFFLQLHRELYFYHNLAISVKKDHSSNIQAQNKRKKDQLVCQVLLL